jgi:hypothetical protein
LLSPFVRTRSSRTRCGKRMKRQRGVDSLQHMHSAVGISGDELVNVTKGGHESKADCEGGREDQRKNVTRTSLQAVCTARHGIRLPHEHPRGQHVEGVVSSTRSRAPSHSAQWSL